MYKDIAKLLLGTSFDILKHYTCPESCGGHCCKIYDIHLEQVDATRISRMNKKNKEIIDSALYDPKFNNVMFSVKPCPFLKADKCSVHKFKPMTCRQYPFAYKYSDGMITFSLETCPLGCDILIDYTNYLG